MGLKKKGFQQDPVRTRSFTGEKRCSEQAPDRHSSAFFREPLDGTGGKVIDVVKRDQRPYTGEYFPAGKAFLPLNIENGAKPILNMVFANETTGINSLSSDDNALQNDWFSLDGTRLNGKPTQRGIYINGNKKVVVK